MQKKGERKRHRRTWICIAVIAAAVVCMLAGTVRMLQRTPVRRQRDLTTGLFGKAAYVFSPSDDPKKVQKVIDDVYDRQKTNQFGDERYGLYFLPGTYDDSITLKVGFGTEAAGLGESPEDTVIGQLWTDADWLGDEGNHNATCNFWRGVSNLTVQKNSEWAVSQATFLRRMHFRGNLALHDNYGWASGGFIADTRVDKVIDSGSQQQWLTRNSSFSNWMGNNWNLVFLGDAPGDDPAASWPATSYTSVESARLVREKPFLAVDPDSGKLLVTVPAAAAHPTGTTWQDENGQGAEPEGPEKSDAASREKAGNTRIPLEDFHIAYPGKDTAESLNAALADGKNIFFTPGVYTLDAPLQVTKADTVLLGSGLATLRPTGGEPALTTADVPGVCIAGLLFDAGEEQCDCLLSVGTERSSDPATLSDDSSGTGETELSSDPVTLSDVFFRVGGTGNASGTDLGACARINTDYTVLDNLWVWRADHGDGVGWDVNRAANGIVINGDHVQAYGLMVEHFQDYQTVWNGDDGELVMYQSELPYDVPAPADWVSHDGTVSGFASIHVADDVTRFSGTGIGIYSYNRDCTVECTSAVEVPETPGVTLYHTITVMLNGNPGISNVVNDSGGHVYHAGEKARLLNWPLVSDYDRQ